MILSLFSGCGGLDLGFTQAGFKIGLAYEKRTNAVASYNKNIGRGKEIAHVADITTLSIEKMDEDFGERFAPIGVVGGPPCQSFSRGNRSRKPDDPRKDLVRTFFTTALELHSKRSPLQFIVMENVTEVALADDGQLLRNQILALESAGFEVHVNLMNAADYGVAQNRKRLFLVALNKDMLSAHWVCPAKKDQKLTVRSAIGFLPKPALYARGVVSDYHPNHWCMQPKSPKFTDGTLVQGRSIGRSFKTLGWDKQSYTVSYGHREVHVHPDCNRRLSVLEAMLLQGFPRDYVLKGTMSDQFSQVSEAVPPPLGFEIAASIIQATQGEAAYSETYSSRALSS